MEVKAGYKQTEVGIIPEDWDVTTIGNVAIVNHGSNTISIVCNERYYDHLTIAWVKTLDHEQFRTSFNEEMSHNQ